MVNFQLAKNITFFAVIMQNLYMEHYRLSGNLEKNILGGRFGIGTYITAAFCGI